MKFKILLLSLLVGLSTTLFAGGGGGPGRSQLWETFHNPLAKYPVEATLSDATIGKLVQLLLEDYEKNRSPDDHGAAGQWARDASLYEALVALVESSGRDLSINRWASNNEDGCLHVLAESRIPSTLFREGLMSGEEDVVSDQIWSNDGSDNGFHVPREDFRQWLKRNRGITTPAERREWNRHPDNRRYRDWYRRATQAWDQVIKGYYWTCNQVDPAAVSYPAEYQQMKRGHREFYPSQEEYQAALPLIEGTKVHEFLENYRRFVNSPTSETARYILAPETRELVQRHTAENQMSRYEQLAAGAEMFLNRDMNKIVEYPGGLPLDELGWAPCAGAGALRGTLALAREWFGDDSLSDLAVRNALYYRFHIAAQCQNRPANSLTAEELQSIPGPWRAYLAALELFYREEYQQAGNAFAQLIESEQVYVAELSTYLAGRAFHIAAQRDWPGYREPAKSVDRSLLVESERYFQQHVDRGGRYANSARGLLRRSAYLAGNSEVYYAGLERHLDLLLSAERDERTAARIIEAVDEGNRYSRGPALLKYLDEHYQTIAGDERLAAVTRLLDFRRGVQRFHASDWRGAYALLLNSSLEPAYPYLVQITQRLDDRQRFAAFYQQFLKGNTRVMHLASLDYAELGAAAFIDTSVASLAKESAVAYCSADELHRLVMENLSHEYLPELRDVLYDAYIQREEFGKLRQLMSSGDLDNGPYEAIRTAVRQLSQGESLGKAYMNIGYFVSTHMAPPRLTSAYDFLAALDENRYCSGGLKSGEKGAQHFFQRSLAQFDADDNSEDEAKALHFMINCRRPGERGCWGSRPSGAASSEELFERLHKKYPTSQWTEKTPYYY